jgi:hypothetical protein
VLAITIVIIAILAHDPVTPANNGWKVDGDVCLYRLACKMDDLARQTGKYKRIAGLADPSTNTEMSMAFLSPQRFTVEMYTNLIF